MKSVKIKAKAKINFTLDVVGISNGFHNIRSLVSTISLKDRIKVTARKDDKIVLKTAGISIGCDNAQNNAYKAAKAFINEFNTNGVNIHINKKIPVGGGLGGSSADISGTLIAMQKLYNVDGDIKKIADGLGSDSGYMLKGGFAVIEGRGEVVTPIDTKVKLYLIILCGKDSVTAKESYSKYDELKGKSPAVTDKARELLESENVDEFIKSMKNDLYIPSVKILPEIKERLEYLSKFAPSVMTGSGSAVIGVFKDKSQRDIAYKTVKKRYKNYAIKAQTE